MACNSCNCRTVQTTCNSNCKDQIFPSDFANLVYIAGVDTNLCNKYATFVDLLDFQQFMFTSGPATIHNITHNLNRSVPFVVVYSQATNKQVIPVDVLIVNMNTVRITTTTPEIIFGRMF